MYMLKKLDGSQLDSTFAVDRLKRFHPPQRLQLDHPTNLEHKEIPIFDAFLGSDNKSKFSDPLDNF